MKKIIFSFALLITLLTSCDLISKISGYDKDKLDITLYANDTEVNGGFSFTASEAWSTFVEYTSESTDWITIDPASGNAGKVTLNIAVEENTTGETRTAIVHIVCGENNLNIDIEQKATENTGNDDNGDDNGDNGGNEPSQKQPVYVIDRIIQTIDQHGQTVTYTYSFEREDDTPGSRITKVRIDGLPREEGAATVYDAYLEYRIAYNNLNNNIEFATYANGYLYQTINAITNGQYIEQYSYSEDIQIMENLADGKEGNVYDGVETHTYYFNRHDHNDQLYRTDYVCETVFEGYEQGYRREETSYNFEWERADIKGSEDIFNHAYNLKQLSWIRDGWEENYEYFSYDSNLNYSYICPGNIPSAPGMFVDINHMISTFWIQGVYKAYGDQQGMLGLIGLIAPPSCNLLSEISYMYGAWEGTPLRISYKLTEDNKRVDSFTMYSVDTEAIVKIEYKEY
ncbi:MAG: BACON domain-containing protein [Bacteroidaceae bacterium]|nr:BACON domain-containing protein [Bacteroidaceae bacterium]